MLALLFLWPPRQFPFVLSPPRDASAGLVFCEGELSDVVADFSKRLTMSRTERSGAFRPEDGTLLARLDEKLCLSPPLSIFLSRMRSGHEGSPVSGPSRRCALFSSMVTGVLRSFHVVVGEVRCMRWNSSVSREEGAGWKSRSFLRYEIRSKGGQPGSTGKSDGNC